MFYVNYEPEGKFLYTETIKSYCRSMAKAFQVRLNRGVARAFLRAKVKITHAC